MNVMQEFLSQSYGVQYVSTLLNKNYSTRYKTLALGKVYHGCNYTVNEKK